MPKPLPVAEPPCLRLVIEDGCIRPGGSNLPMSWRDFWNGEHSIYVSPRHKALHYRAIATDLIGHIPAPNGVVLDHGCGEALDAGRVASACGRLYLCEAAPTCGKAARTSSAARPSPWSRRRRSRPCPRRARSRRRQFADPVSRPRRAGALLEPWRASSSPAAAGDRRCHPARCQPADRRLAAPLLRLARRLPDCGARRARTHRVLRLPQAARAVRALDLYAKPSPS